MVLSIELRRHLVVHTRLELILSEPKSDVTTITPVDNNLPLNYGAKVSKFFEICKSFYI